MRLNNDFVLLNSKLEIYLSEQQRHYLLIAKSEKAMKGHQKHEESNRQEKL